LAEDSKVKLTLTNLLTWSSCFANWNYGCNL